MTIEEKIKPCLIKNCKHCGAECNAFTDVVCRECGVYINGDTNNY